MLDYLLHQGVAYDALVSQLSKVMQGYSIQIAALDALIKAAIKGICCREKMAARSRWFSLHDNSIYIYMYGESLFLCEYRLMAAKAAAIEKDE